MRNDSARNKHCHRMRDVLNHVYFSYSSPFLYYLDSREYKQNNNILNSIKAKRTNPIFNEV